ncbi:ATP10 protein-domain-containing protein [Phaeosphaeriaceae sp. PMI808]|nr:ATP10 protein-domain-containing protein [Phaeosphaeriaceae sp. PMI808]
MLQPRITMPLRRRILNASLACYHSCIKRPGRALLKRASIRSFTTARLLYRPITDDLKPIDTKTAPAITTTPEPNDEDIFIPKPLGRPIGFREPPKAGENTSNKQPKKDYSGMTMSQRNLAKRKDLVEKFGTNYFRDFKNIRKYRSGKTFMANPRIFKQEAALYFPNFHGDTLAESAADTTNVLQGKISVVNVYSSQWGEAQVKTFTGKKTNVALHQLLAQSPHVVQMVDVNIEENSLKAWIIALFQWQLRGSKPQEDWGKYFVVRKGVSEKIRETIGLLNGRVGYVYLVDQDCKIRWAGSGNAEGSEMDDLNRGVGKLVAEAT